jgi:hypothetical protein
MVAKVHSAEMHCSDFSVGDVRVFLQLHSFKPAFRSLYCDISAAPSKASSPQSVS